ncbi:MAG: hypothetical protein Q8O42_22755 [Acidobacteriota bacterium]|nr:hypothetical protein [Acidobacteriota bacterium]
MVAVLLVATTGVAADQPLGVLRITVVVSGGDQRVTPVPRYALLISDNPASAPPRRILTSADGAIEVRLAPGNYTVESDRALAFEGQAYVWTQLVDVVAGRDTVLALTASNAAVEAATADAVPLVEAPAASPSPARNRAATVTIWTPLTRATGTVIGANGLVVTDNPFLGLPVSVQLTATPAIKVAATVLVSDAARNVAILWIDPATAALVEPAPSGCGEVCDLVAIAETKMTGATPPPGTRLPVEPITGFTAAALNEAMRGPAGRQPPYQMPATDFDIALITPLQLYAAHNRRAPIDFKNWSDYVSAIPPVLLVRVTPKLAEGFWTKVARGAAQTQGIAVPPILRPKSGFSHLRAYCGETEVAPIHPFKLEQRLSATEVIYEGLYVFDPAAFPPACGSVRLEVYSEKAPDQPDARTVEPKVVQQIWQDFAPLRDRP